MVNGKVNGSVCRSRQIPSFITATAPSRIISSFVRNRMFLQRIRSISVRATRYSSSGRTKRIGFIPRVFTATPSRPTHRSWTRPTERSIMTRISSATVSSNGPSSCWIPFMRTQSFISQWATPYSGITNGATQQDYMTLSHMMVYRE